jgi:LAO/AO transport system kinase
MNLELKQENIEKIIKGDKRVISRVITYVENNEDDKHQILKSLYKYTGKAYKIGITGPPGAGKSTITDCLVRLMVKEGYKVGVIAVDPTSPYTGGALLGDRVRMNDSSLLENVFIRSMATRGSLGGLCKSVNDVCNVLDASGKDFIILETVGVGQSELDIAKTADTTVVVLVPESGDSIQAMKAGLMEIADLFVINKSDRLGADEIITSLKNMLHLRNPGEDLWEIGLIKAIATKNTGIDILFKDILKHGEHLKSTGLFEKKRLKQAENEIREIVNTGLQKNFWNEKNRHLLEINIKKLVSKETDPYSLSEELFGKK